MKSLLCFVIFISLSYFSYCQTESVFHPPLEIPLRLSGNFGELRSDHFHSGLDFKTQGVTGHKVFAAESGFVSRINVQPGGYGKALYIDHPGGFTTVYGHLLSFNDTIEEFIKTLQYERETHSINIYLKPGDITVARGEVVALSGNSGSSSGPHLHYEIRRARDQKPLNGLFYDFPVTDNIRPVFSRLVLYPISDSAHILDSQDDYIFKLFERNDTFLVHTKTPVYLYGDIGFGVEVYDYLNGESNRCGVYSLELFVDGVRYFYSEMNGFLFSESRFINAHIDYRLKTEKRYNVQRLYKLPFNNLSIYKHLENNGIISIHDTLMHELLVRATDSYGNSSVLSFTFMGAGSGLEAPDAIMHSSITLPHNKPSVFSDEEINLNFPAYCFYEDVDFVFDRTKGGDELLSDIYHIHHETTPVHNYYTIEITIDTLLTTMEDKLCLVLMEGRKFVYVDSKFSDGSLTARVRDFGRYAVTADTLAPEIKPLNFHTGKDLSNEPGIRFSVSDNLSGIKEYNGFIDGHWVLFEYDPKNSLLSYEFDKRLPISKKNHELEIYLIDAVGNKSVYNGLFYR